MLRAVLWRMLGLIAFVMALALLAWLLDGGLGAALRSAAGSARGRVSLANLRRDLAVTGSVVLSWAPVARVSLAGLLGAVLAVTATLVCATRRSARRRRVYVRLEVEAYRADAATAIGLEAMYRSLHKRLLRRWWRRLLWGQPSLALEVHRTAAQAGRPDHTRATEVWLGVACPAGLEAIVEAAVRAAYRNCRLRPAQRAPAPAHAIVRLKKHAGFIKRVDTVDRREWLDEPPMNRLMTVMAACEGPASVQLALTPAPALFERHAKRLYRRHEARLSRERREHLLIRDRSMVEDAELRGGLEVQHKPLFFTDLRVIAPDRTSCERIASELRTRSAENRLVERGTFVRNGLLGAYQRRVRRGEGNPLPSLHRGVFASTELAILWQLPSIDFDAVPFARNAVPRAPAPPPILRAPDGLGTLRDAFGAVTIHEQLRRQNTAVPGAVEQGKSSYLVATVAEDLRRRRCAVIVLDPKGDAAEAAVSLVAPERTCTLLDFAQPRCGFNPLAVDAPADVIADYVVAALKHLFTDADIRASSDRYLRNAIIAVLAFDRNANLWDAARLLSVGEEGYAYRHAVGTRVRTMPAFKEISEFFTAELAAQLADARSTTTAKLDAPVNKLARLLNSPSIKRVLLNDSLTLDFDTLIASEQVLVVKGALGAMGAGNTSVLMQLLVGMLDAALARQQDLVPAERRVAVALKVDEAPLVLNRGFAETIALKRSAGLETVACWQSDAQWPDVEVREQLDALFAHRVYFATASTRDARASAQLTMPEFSDTVRPGIEHLTTLSRPDARLHLPKHHAIASWLTPQGRAPAFIAQTLPLRLDRERLRLHAARQAKRGGRHLSDLRQPHWERRRSPNGQPRPIGDPPPSDSMINGLDPSDRERDATSNGQDSRARVRARSKPAPEAVISGTAAGELPESFRELVELDAAHSVRWARPIEQPRKLAVEPLDLEMLALIASLRHVLTSQVHRRFNPARALTTTQRRLKRLSDAGLVERLQFHRRDGGGVPMCYVVTQLGLRALHADERRPATTRPGHAPGGADAGSQPARDAAPPTKAARSATIQGDRHLRQARHDVHVAGWVLALERALAGYAIVLRGPDESVMSPPLRSGTGVRTAIGPADLRLPGGRMPHGFERTRDAHGERVPVERFETVRPDAILELTVPAGSRAAPAADAVRSKRETARARVRRDMGTAPNGEPMRARAGRDMGTAPNGEPTRARAGPAWRGTNTEPVGATATDVIVERDERVPRGRAATKLERYDHFIAGWSARTARYGPQLGVRPMVVFVCRDRRRARECARQADLVLGACRAYAGEYPFDWEYPGRESIVFAAERDIHEGSTDAYGVPPLPPTVRVGAAHNDPRAGRATVQRRKLVPSRAT